MTVSSDPKSPLAMGNLGSCLMQCYMGSRVSLPNDISLHPTALGWCTSVTDGQTDHATVTSVATNSIIAFSEAA